jgi:amino acid adenylation domain-containing protein
MSGEILTTPAMAAEGAPCPLLAAQHDTLHGSFEVQCAQHPSAVAAICGADSLTYAELNRRADLLARQLTGLGACRGTLVGISVERSLDLAIGLLGILKAGGAYVPLDPAYPVERLEFMLADAQPQVLVTQRALASRLPKFDGALVYLDRLGEADGAAAQVPAEPVRGDDLAYVIYTSGSSGRPKGVMIEHRAAKNTIDDINERFHVGPHDRVLALSSYSFDLSVYDMFGMWAVGACVVLPEATQTRSASDWGQLCRQQRVTIWNTVPASMEMLVTQQEARCDGALDRVRLVLLSGDWIPVTLPDRIRALNPAAQVISLGGATEVSIWSILYPIGQVDPRWTSIPYGTAMRGQSVHVLDEQLREVSPGEEGEIYYGGLGLARGYYRRAELTAERFVFRQAVHGETQRLYASGDLGRLAADGTVELLGRRDGQVKIRGYRVELGEIETALGRHAAVRQAAAIVDAAPSGARGLVAFVVAAAGCQPTVCSLREHLERILPEYMIPAQFILLDALPYTDNQKIDRRALAAMCAARQQQRTTVCACAASDVERRLLRIWQATLGQKSLGIDDNFFEVGGDSLLAAKMFAAIEKEFGWIASLETLLERPTVRELASLLEHAGALGE